MSSAADQGLGEFGYLLLATLPAKKLAVLPRLLLTMLAAAICAWLLGAVLTRLDIPGVDTLLRGTPLAVAFTVFAVSGVTNAINIIDGYNGLAGGYAVIFRQETAWLTGFTLIFCTWYFWLFRSPVAWMQRSAIQET